MSGLRVLVAEDHEDMRAMIVALLSSDFEVVGAVGDGEQLIQSAIFLQPAVIISDISMPFVDGLSAKNDLWSKGLKFPFVFITVLDLETLSFIAEEESVAYVSKLDLFSELKPAIDAVAVGESYISRSFRRQPGN